MADIQGRRSRGQLSREEEFKELFQKNFLKLLRKNVNSQHHSIWYYGSSIRTYYLASENNEYLGFIELEVKNGKGYINLSESNLERGFYLIMFTALFAFTELDEIFSDNTLSLNAVKSYENMNKSEFSKLRINLFNTRTREYAEFDRELINKNNIIISITEKKINSLSENYDEYFKRIYNSESHFNKMFIERNKLLDIHMLYGDLTEI